MSAEVKELVQKLNALRIEDLPDEDQRALLHDALQRATLRMESPHDTIYRIVYSPNLLIVAEVASNLQIFQTLASNAPAPCDTVQLAAVTGADAELTDRIARWLAGHGMVDEEGEGVFVANSTTKTLSDPGFLGGIKHYVYTTLPPLQVLPDFLKDTSHANPSDLANCPFQRGLNTRLTKFDWQKDKHELSSAFGLWMAAQHSSDQTWMNVVDFQAILQSRRPSTPETPIFVDVAGGIGHQCAALKNRFPETHGRVILQDRPEVLLNALPTAGVENMAYDFWERQPITGARAYYFRYIMHDYPDEKCRIILNNTVAAMDNDSVILIDEVVLPDKGAHPYSLDKDIVMMVNFGAMERTTSQWRSLFESCGLQLIHVAAYNSMSGEAVQVLKKQGTE